MHRKNLILILFILWNFIINEKQKIHASKIQWDVSFKNEIYVNKAGIRKMRDISYTNPSVM